ncbi:hypothetical protein HDU96_003212 [Phlyctochytrium bullatum]|nr:hypothetical protein HDU96_003212 [Phlyctochytrium bullatum]
MLQHARGYQVNVTDIKKGQAIEHKGKLWIIQDFRLVTQGRQGSHYKLDLKDAVREGKITERFNQNAILEGVDLVDREFQFLYTAEGMIHLLDAETFEEQALPVDVLEGGSNALPFLTASMPLKVSFAGTKPLLVKLPSYAVYKVVFTETAASTATNESKSKVAFKNATLENDVVLSVPEFIQMGESIVVDLVTGKYKERYKERK